MAWYKTGTVSVTNNSATVTGSGTNFVSGAQVGFGFRDPNGLVYEITAINSATSLTITPVYGGSTASGQSYAIVPTQGLTAALASDVTDLITDYQTVADNAGAGKFGDGSAASPGIRFVNDQDTGFFKDTANEIAVSVGGNKVGEFTSTGIDGTVIGGTTPAAITATTFTSTGIDDNATSTAMTLDSSGNLLVGTTLSPTSLNATTTEEGMAIGGDGLVVISNDSQSPLALNRLSSDGNILNFLKDGTTVGSIGTAGRPYFANNAGDSIMVGDNGLLPRTDTGAAQDGVMNLGGASDRWKDLHLSGGVYLGGTGSANKLDDYETGTWTPTIVSDNATATLTGAGSYVKIGAMVHIRFSAYHVNLSALTNGSIRLGGLPFSTSGEQAFPIMIDTSDNSSQVWVWLGNSASSGSMKQSEFNNALTGAELSDTNDIYLSATYRTA